MTLFERIGGEKTLDRVVDVFYTNVMNDDRLAHFFANVDMDSMREKQKRFLNMVLGGDHQYTGRSIRDAHANLNIRQTDYEAVIEHLELALKEAGVEHEEVDEVIAAANTVRSAVIRKF